MSWVRSNLSRPALSALVALFALPAFVPAQTPAPKADPPGDRTMAATAPTPPPLYDEALATSVGADERGMRKYVLVILKTGPTRVPDGPARDEMFRGHFANMERLASEGKLALAGPLDRVDGWRGLFVLAVPDIEQAKPIVATDPTIQSGEMVAEYHELYASAALMKVNDLHARVQKKGF